VPDEGLGIAVVIPDEESDGLFQFPGGTIGAATQLFVGQRSEPSFHQVDPRRRGRREVQMEARPFRQPVTDQPGFVSSVVIQDQVHVQIGRHG
jgi:hypothetical protein